MCGGRAPLLGETGHIGREVQAALDEAKGHHDRFDTTPERKRRRGEKTVLLVERAPNHRWFGRPVSLHALQKAPFQVVQPHPPESEVLHSIRHPLPTNTPSIIVRYCGKADLRVERRAGRERGSPRGL